MASCPVSLYLSHCATCHYAEYDFTEWYYAECHYAEGRGTIATLAEKHLMLFCLFIKAEYERKGALLNESNLK